MGDTQKQGMGDTQNRPFNEMLDAIGHIQRRKLLLALLTHNPQDDEPVAIVENESADEEFTRLVGMQHVHLPKLEDYGFISWNRDANEVSKGPNFEEIRPLLELLRGHEDDLPDGWL
ncbi:ArsR family transcriptional regulator [Salinirubrum litoreum]|uniref:ArsR family transcriptional regulator n=1 Tax=Salinirubrum litoreum TaxID=1126234 RepID=A0ABD5RBT6_9EURY|nr:ArsR family transcriptional regulator [Salinirubrum litoreum]